MESDLDITESDRFKIFQTFDQNCDFTVLVKKGDLSGLSYIDNEESKSRVEWYEESLKHTVRYMQTKDGMKPYAYSIESCDYATQLYSEDVLKYLDVRLIFDGFDFFWLLNRKGAVTIHASYVGSNGRAIAFCGPSGVGKTTQAKLWEQYRNAEIINGDRVLIQKHENIFYANGISYAGTSKICKNISMPLCAIVVLEQSEENSVQCLSGRESLKSLLPQCAFHKTNGKELDGITSMLAEIITEVPVYLLKCTPDIKAVETLEGVL